MASIHKEIIVDAPSDVVWDAVRDVGNAHTRLFPGVLVDARLDADARIVTFANGLVVRELIVDLDDSARRFAWTAVGGSLSHHNASMQVLTDGDDRTRIVWITDFLPNELAPAIRATADRGTAALKSVLSDATRVSS
jgi:carbon monoxide dehydrogenase subunit G